VTSRSRCVAAGFRRTRARPLRVWRLQNLGGALLLQLCFRLFAARAIEHEKLRQRAQVGNRLDELHGLPALRAQRRTWNISRHIAKHRPSRKFSNSGEILKCNVDRNQSGRFQMAMLSVARGGDGPLAAARRDLTSKRVAVDANPLLRAPTVAPPKGRQSCSFAKRRTGRSSHAWPR
jgi:hypothetical protein